MNFIHIHYVLLLLLQVAAGALITAVTYEFIYKSQEYRDIRDEILRLILRRK